MHKGIQWDGKIPLEAQQVRLINRTGAAMVRGRVYAIDSSRTATESTDAVKAMANAVAVAAGNIDGLHVVALDNTPDDEAGLFVLNGPAYVLVDGTTIDVANGDKLIATAGSANLTRSDAATDVVRGIAFDSNTGAAALKLVYFLGIPATRPGTDEA